MKMAKKIGIVFIVFAWLFSGWPPLWQNPRFPPKIRVAQAATTGAIYPSLGETAAESPWLDNDWTTPTNIYADDAATANVIAATFDSPDQTYVLKATGFNFSAIPDGSTINGIIVRTNAWYRSGQGSGSMDLCQLLDTSKAKVGTNQCATPVALTTTNTTVITKGSSTDLWGNSLTAAWVKNANFGVAIGMLATAANADVDVDYVTIEIYYTPPSTPTVTTQDSSSIEATTATCNGNITDTGGANATARGCEWDTDSGAPYANSASDTGDYGTGAFTKGLTGLPSGTTVYARAFATNPGGTGYGSEVFFLTKPAAPTNVAATDGTYNDKVTITWTKSTGATDYHVWRDATDLGSAGDVATFDDTGAGAPSITPGTTVATDGTSTSYVALSLSGTSANNGTTHTYKVVASNATGNSVDSTTDTGYRGVGSLTYQWQRSAADSDASYSDIGGATAATYDDTGAPADGSGRYYKCVLSATGVSNQTSVSDRGYRAVISITITDSGTIAYGTMATGQTQSTFDLTPAGTKTAQNSGNVAENFSISSSNAVGGTTWTLGASAGTNVFKHEFSTNSGGGWTTFPVDNSYATMATGVAVSGTVNLDLRITTPISSDNIQKTVTVTILATQ